MKVDVTLDNCTWACDGVLFNDHPHPDQFELDLDIGPFLDDLESEAIVWGWLQERGVCLIDGEITIEKDKQSC